MKILPSDYPYITCNDIQSSFTFWGIELSMISIISKMVKEIYNKDPPVTIKKQVIEKY